MQIFSLLALIPRMITRNDVYRRRITQWEKHVMDDRKQLLWQMQRQQWQSRLATFQRHYEELRAQSRDLWALTAEVRTESLALCRALRIARGSPPDASA